MSVFTQGTLEVGAPVEIATASVVVLAEVLSITPGEGGYLAIMRVEHALDLEEMAAIGRAWDEAGIAGERSMEPSLSRLLAGLYTPDARGHDQDEPKTDQVQVSRDSTS